MKKNTGMALMGIGAGFTLPYLINAKATNGKSLGVMAKDHPFATAALIIGGIAVFGPTIRKAM